MLRCSSTAGFCTLLNSGKATVELNKIVDNYTVIDGKKRKLRPSKPVVREVLDAAIAQFPRLFSWADESKSVLKFLTWSPSPTNQVMFHNECMTCARMSLREVSQKRLLLHQAPPPEQKGDVSEPVGAGDERPQANPVTPPQGR